MTQDLRRILRRLATALLIGRRWRGG